MYPIYKENKEKTVFFRVNSQYQFDVVTVVEQKGHRKEYCCYSENSTDGAHSDFTKKIHSVVRDNEDSSEARFFRAVEKVRGMLPGKD